MSNFFSKMKELVSGYFSLAEDRADEQVIVEGIRKNVSFKGTNLWALIFAIFIASIGLNVNSTAVIIGAMLISPIMGPIMGIGLSVAINDFELLKRSVKNLLVAAFISIGTSFIYFSISPLHQASSELLARTTPSIWDVFIAFLGGLAGIVAGTRKEKSNVLPGVAIATALMPPLCTAGFGLATGQWYFVLGAVYLFFINSLFICVATFIIVKHLRFHKVEFTTSEREKKVSRYMVVITVLTVMPSVYLGYRIVQRSIFESNADRFVTEQFHFAKTQVVTKKYLYDGPVHEIELLLVGQPLTEELIDTIRRRIPAYKLGNTKLVLHQGLDAKQKIDLSAIKASVLEELYATQMNGEGMIADSVSYANGLPEIKSELKILYPSLVEYSIGKAVMIHTDKIGNDTVTLFTGKFNPTPPAKDIRTLEQWIKQRIDADSLKVIIE